jgi:putative aldouronate transport system substrate-binding protein
MLRRHLLMAGTAIALTAAMVGSAMAQATVVRIVAGDLVPDDPASEQYIANIEAGVKTMDGSDIDLQIVPIAASSYADKLSALLLGGDIPDLIYFQGGDQKMVEQGVLADLNPLIANTTYLKNELYGHNVERMKNYPYLVYNFPPRAPQPVIRTDWLEKLGGKKPETVDEYTALFQAIHDGDLDGDGTPGNTLGLTAFVNTNELDDIFNQAFGVNATWMKDASGAWVHSRVTEQEKAKIAYYADLAAKGLFDKEYVTNKFDVKEDKFYTGKAGVIFGSSAETVAIYGGKMAAAHPGEDITLTLLPVPKGPGGQGLQAVDVSKESRGWAISAVAAPEVQQAAMKVMDFLASPEGQVVDRMGFEGTHYTKAADGTITVNPDMATWYARFSYAPSFVPPTEWREQVSLDFLDSVNKWFTADNSFVWPAELAPDVDAAENVYRSWVARFITGEAGMDQWDAYVAEWTAAGGQRMTDYARTVLK